MLLHPFYPEPNYWPITVKIEFIYGTHLFLKQCETINFRYYFPLTRKKKGGGGKGEKGEFEEEEEKKKKKERKKAILSQLPKERTQSLSPVSF